MARPLAALVLFSVLIFPNLNAQTPDTEPVLTGYVTRVASDTDFDANGFHIALGPKSQTFQGSVDHNVPHVTGGKPFFGEQVLIFGKIDRKKNQIEAARIIFCKPEPRVLSGFAVVDRILRPASHDELLLRADGYFIQVAPTTKIAFADPLHSLSQIVPNVWISYHGTLSSDGTFLADNVSFQPNDISNGEDKFLQKSEYDPSKIPDDAKQSAISKSFFGINPKMIPPYHDPAMQARIDRIGSSLIPAYQRNLPNSDPSKLSFRFQIIDNAKFHDALALPNGIILVPRQVVERLQNDSQLAAVLADNIATVMEKQSYRLLPARKAMTASQWAAAAGGFVVPGLGIAAGVASYAANKSIQADTLEQSGRVSLGLLHDAGYDLQQAPVTWWLLEAKPGKDLSSTKIPPRSIALYRTISQLWSSNLPPVGYLKATDPSPNHF
ncbi:MAG TPA: hypothetical protein VL495_05410 [Edaphobacter sp.]|nr:hypothetical protein [Edaphobacter sp.]